MAGVLGFRGRSGRRASVAVAASVLAAGALFAASAVASAGGEGKGGRSRGGRVGDLVWLDANHDGVQQRGERGVRGVSVELWKMPERALVRRVKTGGNGRYSFSGLETNRCYRSKC